MKSYSKKARGIFVTAQGVEGVPAGGSGLDFLTVSGTLTGDAIGAFTAFVTVTGAVSGSGVLFGFADTSTYTGTISDVFTGTVSNTGILTGGVNITGGSSGSGIIIDGEATLISRPIHPSDVIACFEPTYDTEISSDTLEYAGDEFSRDIRTDITDRVLNCSFTTLMPALGIPVGAPNILDFPLESLFEATGATVTYYDFASNSLVRVSNETVSNNQITIMVAAVSADNVHLQKTYRGFDGNTSVDLDLEVDKRAKLKWSPKAIPVDDAVIPEAFPEEIFKIVPDYGNQKINIMPSLSAKNITQAELVVFGTVDLSEPFGSSIKNFCFSKITATNLFGFTWERLHNSCQTGFEKLVAVPDVTITILEDDLDATLQPDKNVTNGGMLEGYFSFALTYGKVAGKKTYLHFDKLQCVNVKNTEIGSRSAKELSFKNCSFTTLCFNAE